jgi:hypothetical protein
VICSVHIQRYDARSSTGARLLTDIAEATGLVEGFGEALRGCGAGIVPLFSSQWVVFRSSDQPTPGP